MGAEAVRRLEVEDFPATVINDIFGLFDGKKPTKYMEIRKLGYTTPCPKSHILMTYIESSEPSDLPISKLDIILK